MSTKPIREFSGKELLCKWLTANAPEFKMQDFCFVNPNTNMDKLAELNPWVKTKKLVCKPDQLIKRRGKSGLIKLNATWEQGKAWINERRGKEVKVEVVSGVLDYFLIEEFVPHPQSDEYYICINATRAGDEILFYHEGGVDVGDVDAKALRHTVKISEELTEREIVSSLLTHVPQVRQNSLTRFILQLYAFFKALHFSYLEINPLVVMDGDVVLSLDMAAKIDETAKFLCGKKWGPISFPAPFGRPKMPQEEHIADLDARTGASLKLTVLNPEGRVWTMVAGGGASVIYADTLCDLGAGAELANYGEYSGAPSEKDTYEYANAVLSLMTAKPHPKGKILIIGGGIANFTDIAATFKGIIRALKKYQTEIREQNCKIFVRRGGPNWKQGLQLMRDVSEELNLECQVYGPESNMTIIVSLALERKLSTHKPKYVPQLPAAKDSSKVKLVEDVEMSDAKDAKRKSPPSNGTAKPSALKKRKTEPTMVDVKNASEAKQWYNLFTNKTRALIWGMQRGPVQNMLDFDFICDREQPSVAGMVYPFTGNHYQKFYWNTKEILIPIFQTLDEALSKNPDVDVVINFSSFRSVYETTMQILKAPQINVVAIIAEGVPERQTRELLEVAAKNKVNVIGPATVGGIKPGCFRIGNTGGMLENIISSKLYRPGSVAYVARSGGMSNEMNNIIAQNADGVYEGVAIGGDRYPGSTFVDHLIRYQANPAVKIMIVLGEVGGVEEYEICRLIENKTLTKPIVAWCIGTCAKLFPYEVQFGHAGACAQGKTETADAKNLALKALGVFVPESFEDFGNCINKIYSKLVEDGTITVLTEKQQPSVPVDFKWANKLGLIRKPSNFISSIVDERGEELVYAGMKISEVFSQNIGIGGVVGLIWFRRRLPEYCCKFIEMVLMVTADHGPAVAGAHNTIVCARAGKDLISSLTSGLLTIGPRFGGALDDAARIFSWGLDQRFSAEDFVVAMSKKKELIMGIGHKVKSLENPDARVTIVKNFVKKNFASHDVLSFAESVEQVTTKKKSNLILNVDGAIACAFVDLLRTCGAFTPEEAQEYIDMGVLNGLFVLGRSIGFIGHFLDQKRLKQGLYRHDTDDISYIVGQAL